MQITTGYATTDFNLWPPLSQGMFLLLMLIGGIARLDRWRDAG
jgi:Trk-type K+ transport system membrane component